MPVEMEIEDQDAQDAIDASAAPESGQPAGGREAPPEDDEGVPFGTPPESSGEDF